MLVDANIIIECYRTKSWRALRGAYQVETVRTCVTETQTGSSRRSVEQQIDQRHLESSLKAVHEVSERQSGQLILRAPDIPLGPGESDLWAHVVNRQDNWLLCGPDRSSLQMGIRLGFREHLTSLEALLLDAGYRLTSNLNDAYTKKWHDRTVGELVLNEKPPR